MKLFSKKKVVYELTPEQKAFLATCHELTRDELRLVNGGANYGRNGMPSNIPVSASNSEKNESPVNASAASASSSYTGGSRGYNGMPSDVQEKMKSDSGTSGSSSSGTSNVSSTSSTSSGSTSASGTSSSGTGSSSSLCNSSDSGTKESGSNVSSSESSFQSSSNSSSSSSASGSSSGGTSSSGESKTPFPQPYAGAYEHGSYAEEKKSDVENKSAPSQDFDAESNTLSNGDDGTDLQSEPVVPEKKKGLLARAFDSLFKNDGKKTVYTYGGVASATWITGSDAVNAGVYIDPKNDILHMVSIAMMALGNPFCKSIGSLIFSNNIEHTGTYVAGEAGLGYGASASLSVKFGAYESLEAFHWR